MDSVKQNIYYFRNVPSYFTRILLGNKSLQDMKSEYPYEVRDKTNFIELDGITTFIDVNNLSFTPNYVVVENEDGTISRWFVLDHNKTRGKQQRLNLKRDTITDFYSLVSSAPIYIEKCMLPKENPLIFNSENMAFNQIKQSETLLADETNVGWIVGYVAPSSEDRDFTFTIQNDVSIIDRHDITKSEWDFEQYETTPFKSLGYSGVNYDLRMSTFDSNDTTPRKKYSREFYYHHTSYTGCGNEVSEEIPYFYPIENINGIVFEKSNYNKLLNDAYDELIPSWLNWNSIYQYISTKYSIQFNQTNPLTQFNGKKIRFSDGLYSISVYSRQKTESDLNDDGLAQIIGNNINSHLPIYTLGTGLAINNMACHSYIQYEEYYLDLVRVYDDSQLQGKIPATANNLKDQPYIMFALPSSEFTIDNIQMDDNIGFLFARALAEKYSGAGGIYDLQLLPYCPIYRPDTLVGKTQGSDYAFIKNESNNNVGVVFFGLESKFEVKLDYPVSDISTDDISFKVKSQTEFIRLVSPNQQGIFEMNQYKNNGIEYFTALCTYKPYSPFIYIEPKFKNIYGETFDDGRGLVCAGDFSLPQTSDAFETYALQNKNYINSFNRTIENMDVTYQLNKTEAIVNGIGNTIGAGIGGSMTGAIATGNPFGALAGGVIGAGANAVALGLDMKMMEKRFNESKSYATDQFNYSLQNIKARPDSLSKVGAIDNIFKIFPVLERYSATEEEQEAFRKKIEYNGMTAMFISTINQLGGIQKGRWIQGQLIRIDSSVSNKIVSDIAEELKKGVFWN